MTEKFYDVYFDPSEIEVDRKGDLQNQDALQIIEFEYSEDTEEVTACRRVDEKGNVIEDHPNIHGLDHSGDGDDLTIDAALGRFEGWLTDNLEWRESYRGDYYNPPEYICIGITGYVDEPPYRHHHISDTVIRAILNRRR